MQEQLGGTFFMKTKVASTIHAFLRNVDAEVRMTTYSGKFYMFPIIWYYNQV